MWLHTPVIRTPGAGDQRGTRPIAVKSPVVPSVYCWAGVSWRAPANDQRPSAVPAAPRSIATGPEPPHQPASIEARTPGAAPGIVYCTTPEGAAKSVRRPLAPTRIAVPPFSGWSMPATRT